MEDFEWDFNRGPLVITNPETNKPFSRPFGLYIDIKNAYYSGNPKMSDIAFDAFEDRIRAEYPNFPALEVVGKVNRLDSKKSSHWLYEIKYGKGE